MEHYVVHNGNAPWGNFLEGIFEFSHLLISNNCNRREKSTISESIRQVNLKQENQTSP